MNPNTFHRARGFSAAALLALLTAACGGGGGSPSDIRTNPTPPPPLPTVVAGPDKFLLFPNPQQMPDGTLQTNSPEFTIAYYEAIDPLNERDTLAKWKAKNGWDTGTGEQITVVFGDTRDLGYGRRMNVRRAPDGTLSFWVENYLVQTGAGYAYNTLNLDAAVVRDTRHFIGVNAIEFSPGPNGGAAFPKFYNFSSTTGIRASAVSLDGRGEKQMPGPCITCHGGRGDALTPPNAQGKRLFNLVRNSASQHRGDVEAHLHPFEMEVFGHSTMPGFTRSEQEANVKKINQWILCTYPLASPSALPEDQCRRPANTNEWQGTAAELLKGFYGGPGMPSATSTDTYIPEGWRTAGQATLYQNVVAPYCRTCHIMRGSAGNSDLDFTTYEKFRGYADRINVHVLDRGNMPLAKIVYDAYWGGTTGPNSMATFLEGQGITARSNGALLMPGRPYADPGPSRVTLPGATALDARNSLYANGYTWSIVSGPTGASITNATSAQATFNATANGSYVVQLVVANGSTQGTPKQITIVVDSALTPAPSAIRFADIKSVMQTGNLCTNCHSPTGNLPRPPVFYSQEDRNGDGTVADATDDLWFYNEVRGRINFTEIAASPLLRKPSGNHHGGNQLSGFNATVPPGHPDRFRFDLFQNWILNGAPQ